MKYEKVLHKNLETPGYTGSLADYERQGGYQAIRKALKEYAPAQLTDLSSGPASAAAAARDSRPG